MSGDERDEPEQQAPAAEIGGPGLDEHDQAVRGALSEPGSYFVDLSAMFAARDRDDLIEP